MGLERLAPDGPTGPARGEPSDRPARPARTGLPSEPELRPTEAWGVSAQQQERAGRSRSGSGTGTGRSSAKRSAGRATRAERPRKPFPTREEREQRAENRAAARAKEIAADPTGCARQVCLQLLEIGPRTRSELARALTKKGIPDEAAEQVLSRFAEVGIIDDALFASMWISSRHRGRGLAGRALSQELRRKGVDDDTIRDAVAELDPDQEAETARALVRRKLASSQRLAPEARLRRLVGMLARKGYGPGLAFRIVKEELEQEGADLRALVLDTDDLAALEGDDPLG